MKRSSKVAIPFLQVAALICLWTTSALSQIREVDRSKLPQGDAIQHVYTDLLPIDQYARTYEAKWRFPIPKSEVTSRFLLALHTLEEAQKQNPANRELQLFTGLVAHLAYNLDIEEAYDPAVKLLQPEGNEDFRAVWFLGIHECQSNDPVGGMQRLLHVETLPVTLPRAFWEDYANCASVADMPVHAIRAYDNARKIPDGSPIDKQLEQIARNRIKSSSVTASYPAKQVWYAKQTADQVLFTSNICGQSFTTKATSHLNFGDVTKGTCTVKIDTDQYPDRHGSSSASLLVFTQIARPGESLEGFSQRMLQDPRYADKTPIAGIPCPVAKCLSFEIVTDKLYEKEGGAHLLAVFFQSEQPPYPGLRFEIPQPLPKATNNSSGPNFFRPEDPLQRFSGTLYTVIVLDANQDIFDHARIDFNNLLKSIVIDTK